MKMSQQDKYSILSRESEVDIIRKVILTMNEQKKYEVIKKLVDTNGNKDRAAIELGCTRRTVDRLIKAYRERGKAAFSHGNKGRSPAHTKPDDIRQQIPLLYENKYFDTNIRHFTELLAKNDGITISEGTARTILLEKGILSPKAHRSTRKALKEKLRAEMQTASTKKSRSDAAHKMLLADDPHPRRPRCQFAGEMIQMDASLHPWFGGSKTTLHAAIDDATGMIAGAWFDKQETLSGYYHVFRQILTDYGIPYMFYTDRRTVFEKQPDEEKIDQFLAVITPRKVDAGHCIRFQNKYYELKDEQGMRSDFHKGTSVMVIRTLSGKLYASVCERIYCMDEVPSHEQSSRYFGSDQSTKAEKKKRYIPDMNHPWKKDNFMKYVHAMVGREEHWACGEDPGNVYAAGGSLSNAPWNNISSITYRQKHRFHGADVINFLRHFQKRLTLFYYFIPENS